MKKKSFAPFLFAIVTLTLVACERNFFNDDVVRRDLVLELPSEPFQYPDFKTELKKAGHEFLGGGQNIKVTNAGAQLGRVLFYDPQLSLNNRISCSSCHHQKLAFADAGAFSRGFNNKMTQRNSMAIVNIHGNNNFFWDSRVNSLTTMALMPIRDHVEMGIENIGQLELKLSRIPYYPDLFQKAFGDTKITEERIASALAQFMSSMVSFNSKFDIGKKNNFSNFNPLEKMGMELFFSEKSLCSSCHSGPNFSAPDFPRGAYSSPTVAGTANIGLDLVYRDNGKHEGQFKIPTLRNIELTAPYMHDGRFKTLEEVIEHYNSGVMLHHNLDPKLRQGQTPRRLNLNNIEKQALIAFLKTLTDNQFIHDERYSNPFKM